MRYKILTLIIAIICLISFCSCSYSPSGGEIVPGIGEAQKGGIIRISSEHPDTLNPLKTQIQSNYNMLMLVFEGLFMVQSNQRVVPVLAEDYSVSDDGIEYIINVRQNIKFHDGKVLSAKDVIYTMNNIDKYCPKYKYIFDNIDVFYSLGNDKVVIKLIKPVMNFIGSLSFPVMSEVTPLSAFEGLDTDFVPVGTGEFMFRDRISRLGATLVRNNSWHKETGYIDGVEVLFVDNIQTAKHSFNANLIDMITTNEYRWGDFSLTENYKTYEYENNVYEYIGFNHKNPVFFSNSVKKAIYTAIDRDRITEEIMHSHAEKAFIPIQNGSYFYPANQKAKEPDKDIIMPLLDSDGWVDVDSNRVYEKKVGDKRYELSFSFLINADEYNSLQIAQAVVDSLAECKISARIVSLGAEDYDKAYKNGEYDLILAKTYMDMGSFLRNMPGVSGDGLTRQLDQMCCSKNEDELKHQTEKLCELFLAELPHIPLFFETSALFIKNNVKGTPDPSHSWVYNGITELFVKIDGGKND